MTDKTADELRQLAHHAYQLGRYAECMANAIDLRAAGHDGHAMGELQRARVILFRLPAWAKELA